MHVTALAVVIVQRVMLNAAIVPERHGARLPTDPAGELLLLAVIEKETQHHVALTAPHPLDPLREGSVDIQRLVAGPWMSPDDWMFDGPTSSIVHFQVHRLPVSLVAVTVTTTAILTGGGVHAYEAIDDAFHRV